VAAPALTERRSLPVLPIPPRRIARAARLRRHWGLGVLLAGGVALRVLALVAIYPGIWFSDTNDYVREAVTGTLSPVRVGGYALFVAPFWNLGSAGALIVVQHVLGLAIVVAVYALLVHRGAPRWVACLAAAPAALDLYLVDIEHMIMSETVFHVALVAAFVLLLWRERPGPAAAAAAGLALGYAAVVRSVAMPFVALVALYLVARHAGRRALPAFAVGWLLVVGGYAAIYDAQHGHLGFSDYGGRFLYGQVAPFADCSRLTDLPPDEALLCPDLALHLNRTLLMWGSRSPLHGQPLRADGRIGDFAKRVIRAQPGDFASLVATSFIHYLEPGHHTTGNDYPVSAWQFPADPRVYHYPAYRGPIRPGSRHRLRGSDPGPLITRLVRRGPRLDVAVSRDLHYAQRYLSVSGEVFVPCLAIVALALVLRRGSRRLRLDAALLAACALTALAVAALLSVFDYRYALSAVILLPAAAALAGTALLRPEAARP
jgi:hypothetical protein